VVLGCGYWFILNDIAATKRYVYEDVQVELTFIVTDARTHAPIPRAKVIVGAEGDPGTHKEAETGADGVARLVVACDGVMKAGWLRRSTTVRFGGWQFEVENAGYAKSGPKALGEVIGFARSADGLPPRTIAVALQRLEMRGALR
jgi:hypothetical protein